MTRLSREREFHNEAFSDARRAPLGRFYAVVSGARKRFEQQAVEGSREGWVLEYGCGAGSYAYRLAETSRRVYGVDISDVAVAQARAAATQRGLRNVEFERMNAEELAFASSTFDLVCGVAILHHLDMRKAFAELARVLKPTGRAVFIEPLGHNPLINLYRRLTPSLRTVDEHPLLVHDISLADDYFARVSTDYFTLTNLAVVPFHGTGLFRPLLNMAERIDRDLFKICPPLRRHAWQVVLTLSDPRKICREQESSKRQN